MDISRFKKYMFKLLVMELITFVLVTALWFFSTIPFLVCLFIIGGIFAGLGSLFYFSANKEILRDYRRRAVGTSMTYGESGQLALEDRTLGMFQASLFLWSGLIAAALSLAYDYFQNP